MLARSKVLSLLVTVMMLAASVGTAPVLAAPTVYLEGMELTFDTPPVIENGRALVPLRAIFETLGATVTWIEHNRTAVAIKEDTMVTIQVDSTQPYINAIVHPLDVPARIIDGRIYAPLRFAVEAFGGTADWDPLTQTITLHAYPAGTPTGSHRFNPVPMNQPYTTVDGLTITLTEMLEADSAWAVLQDPLLLNSCPTDDMKYVVVTCKVDKISVTKYPQPISEADFELVGSSNQLIKSFDKTVVQPEEGQYRELRALLSQGESITASLVYYIPYAEDNLVLVWQPFRSDRVYFEVQPTPVVALPVPPGMAGTN